MASMYALSPSVLIWARWVNLAGTSLDLRPLGGENESMSRRRLLLFVLLVAHVFAAALLVRPVYPEQ